MRRQEFERRAFPILLWVIIVLVVLAVISRFMPAVRQPSSSPTATSASKAAHQ